MKVTLFCLLILTSKLCLANDLVFVTNAKSDFTSLNREKIKAIFLKKIENWDNGTRIRPISLPIDTKERQYFLKFFLQMNESQVTDYWIISRQRSGLTKPMQVSSITMRLHIIATLPGTIGYFDKEDLKHKDFLNKLKRQEIKIISTEED
jgi:ABC-type phosphate transport system substrate-binding protein